MPSEVQSLEKSVLCWRARDSGFAQVDSARFTKSQREGHVVLMWSSARSVVVHGGRTLARNNERPNVISELLVWDMEAPSPWREVLSISKQATLLVRGPARWQHAGVMYDSGNLLIHGGKDSDGKVRNETFRFNFHTLIWESFDRWAGGVAPPHMHGHGMVSLPPVGALVVLGPCLQRRPKRRSSVGTSAAEAMTMFVLDFAEHDRCWKAVSSCEGQALPPPRRHFGFAATAQGNQLFMCGGEYRGRYFSDVWQYGVGDGVWSQLRFDSPRLCPFNTTAAAGMIFVSATAFYRQHQRGETLSGCPDMGARFVSVAGNVAPDNNAIEVFVVGSSGAVWSIFLPTTDVPAAQ